MLIGFRKVVPVVALCPLAFALGQEVGAPAFEVASVKVASSGERVRTSGGPGTSDPGQVTYTAARLRPLLLQAYGLRPFQLIGPDVIDTRQYDIVAKIPPGTTTQQLSQMLQRLFVERFGLTYHYETKEFAYREIVVARGGPKLAAAEPAPGASVPADDSHASAAPAWPHAGAPPLPPGTRRVLMIGTPYSRFGLFVRMYTVADMASLLSGYSSLPIVDGAKLAGVYDFTLEFDPEVGPLAQTASSAIPASQPSQEAAPEVPGRAPGPTIAQALLSLGLALQSRKGPFEVLVVDHLDAVPKDN
jgi:uncharacterized protein (TIGR03435 family)